MQPDFEFLRDIAAAVDGILEPRFCLNTYGDENICGTIACTAGWMVKHPKLSLGEADPLRWRRLASERISGDRFSESTSAESPWALANILFRCPRGYEDSSKATFGRRVIRYLESHKQSISEEYRAKYAA